jgi:hypothetical protein
MGFTHLQIEWDPWLLPPDPLFSALCPQLNLLNPPPPPQNNSWVCHYIEVTDAGRLDLFSDGLQMLRHVTIWTSTLIAWIKIKKLHICGPQLFSKQFVCLRVQCYGFLLVRDLHTERWQFITDFQGESLKQDLCLRSFLSQFFMFPIFFLLPDNIL